MKTTERKTADTELVIVFNLANATERFYSTSPIESLITAAIMDAKQTCSIHDERTRETFKRKITYGEVSAAIGDLCVLI